MQRDSPCALQADTEKPEESRGKRNKYAMKRLSLNEMSILQGGKVNWKCVYKTTILIAEAGVVITACVESGGVLCGAGVGLAAAAYAEYLSACYPDLMV